MTLNFHWLRDLWEDWQICQRYKREEKTARLIDVHIKNGGRMLNDRQT